ncbi:MAG: hypothetical protein AAFY14_08230 [Pseudomonadota bacterium]
MPDPVILLSVLWITGLVIWAYWYYSREAAQEKARKLAATKKVSAALRKQMDSYKKQYQPLPEDRSLYPDYARDGFVLIDVSEAAMYHPPKDPLPRLSAKRAMAQGDAVHLLLSDGHIDDDLWVEIIEIRTDDCFAGRIYDVELDKLKRLIGRDIVFHANHISEIIKVTADVPKH